MPSIEKRGDSYRIIASTGYTASGRKMRKTMTWKPDPGMTARQIEREVQRQAVLFEERVQQGEAADGTIKLSAFSDIWFAQHAIPQLAPKTVQEYRKLWSRISTALGHFRMDKIKATHLQDFYVNLSERGVNEKTGGRLSASTVAHYHRLLSSMFSYAVRMGVVAANPAARVKPPRSTQKEAACLTEEQAAALLEALEAEAPPFRAMVSMLLYTGLRKSELHGLQWVDLDAERGVLRVERELQYIQGQGLHVRPPKNKSSSRAVKLPLGLLDTLKQYRAWQTQERLKAGDAWHNEGWLFTQLDGRPKHPDSLPKQFKAFLRRCGLPQDVHLHTLRHSCASFLIAAGVDIRTVAKRLGHAQVSTTGNIYAHQIRSADEAAAEALDILLARKA